MTLKSAIKSARTRFAHHGQFSLRPGESIDKVVSRKKVPNAWGIYIYFRRDDLKRPLYIGKAGTLKTDGSWKGQGLTKRLTNIRKRMYGRKFFRKLMGEKGVGLTFFWFVTHDQNSKIIPALAEAELLQAYYDTYGCLPEKNESV